MPKIVINEYDKTTGVSSTIPGVTDIAYIPGFTINDIPDSPVMCSTTYDFERIFGSEPKLLEKNKYTFLSADEYDRSYIMARELINMGMPVIYHALGKDSKVSSSVTFSAYPEGAENYIIKGNEYSLYSGARLVVTPAVDDGDNLTSYSLSFRVSNVDDTNPDIEPSLTIYDAVNESSLYNIFDNYTNLIEGMKGAFTLTSNVSCDIVVNAVDMLYDEATSPETYDINAYKNEVKGFLESDFGLKDRSEYSVKYITSGAYANDSSGVNIYGEMEKCAKDRGDAIALYEATVTENTDYMKDFVETNAISGGSYGACFACAGTYRVAGYAKDGDGNYTKNTCVLPGAFGYLITLARNIKTIPNYLATAGVGRGTVPNLISLIPKEKLSQAKADRFTKHSNYGETGTCVNPIAYLNPEGYTIWGNRTLKPVTTAGSSGVSFLNIRNMLSDIKKRAYTVSRARLFEQNSDTLWLDFKSEMIPLLEQLKSGNAISNYKILRSETDVNGKRYSREEFGCRIQIIPMYSVEVFSIDVELVDNETNVSGD